MIIDNAGKLVWFKATPGKVSADFRVQTYQGKPVLTWWEGQLFVGDGDGVGQVYDSNYKPIAQVRSGNGYTFDLHEFTITPRNTALVLAYERYNRSLTAWGGPKDAKIVDNIVQEVDLATGLVLFEWHSFGNVSPDESVHARAQAERLRVGVLPRQRDRSRQRRQLPRLRPQHARRSTRSTARRARSSGAWAARSRPSSSARA